MARRAAADEWARLRDLRLQALADAPEAFAATLAESAARTDDEWRQRYAQDAGQATFVEMDDAGRFTGMASGFRDGPIVLLAGMFVVPECRGRGLGRRLVEAVEAWAIETGAARVELDVNPAVVAAVRLYDSCGYVPTGRTLPLPSNPDATIVQLTKELGRQT
jgi:GNAT superfamily N-acetyltransferase